MADLPDRELYLPEKYSHLTPHEYVKTLIAFVKQYDHLINIHIVNFITTDQWQLLDPEWQTALLPTDVNNEDDWIQQLINITSGNTENDTWPASLKEYVQHTRDMALPRGFLSDYDVDVCQLEQDYQRGMNDKKIHEVGFMSTLIDRVATRRNIDSVMDLGAGQGYLARAIAWKYGLRVLAVDGSEVQTCGAKRIDHNILKRTSKQNGQVHHVTEMVTPENISGILSNWQTSNGQHKDTMEPWLLCGLHACGDLSSLMLRLFAESDEMGSLVNVGCCHHFLTQEEGFPMSSFVNKELGYQQTSTAHMLACQTPSRWTDRAEETLKSFEHHFFRALLQHIMVEKGLTPVDKAPIVGRLNKKKDFISFPIYVRAALKRFGLPEDTISAQEAEAYYEKYKNHKQIDKQIAVLWTIRVLLAPVLESIILMDRWLYLKESLLQYPDTKTKGVWMWPLFDPIISPRNTVIVASK
ncbi:cra-b-like protein [Lichtheimia corymbifera JMRC:FSU:9682]|uniref:Cra-b-like protein n=1 Tax=Lichtheimia corymbifera JMRC:FSU:9682 TaxID=1263082 RepID=A0A068SHM6_9FUNG|nr:cra-b-like protein [Lichtheimia corymbifera JMRC:FSU:9682]